MSQLSKSAIEQRPDSECCLSSEKPRAHLCQLRPQRTQVATSRWNQRQDLSEDLEVCKGIATGPGNAASHTCEFVQTSLSCGSSFLRVAPLARGWGVLERRSRCWLALQI
jgi:hypothetical protein